MCVSSSATHCDLEQWVRAGRFRTDLFYRLTVLRLNLPPLREHPDDLVTLADWRLTHALALWESHRVPICKPC